MATQNSRHYFKEMRLQQFRSFCEIARRKSFSGTAAALGMSRAAVWQQIRSLEREFGTMLVRRKGRGAELTDDGHLLLELATPLVSSFDSIKSLFEDRKQQLVRKLVVVTGASLLANELREPIRQYLRLWPQVHLTLIDRTSLQAIGLLENGDVDLGVVGHLDEMPTSPRLEYEFVSVYPFMLACSQNHELVGKRALRIKSLMRYPMVLMAPESVTRQRVEQVFRQHGVLDRLNVILETTNDNLIADYVALGMGITIMPLPEETFRARKLYVRSVARWFGEEHFAIVRPKGVYELSHVTAFRQLVHSALAASP